MILICYGTRPEIIKLNPIIKSFKKNNIEFKTLFTSQHKTLFKDFQNFIPEPDIVLTDIFSEGQSINQMLGKIITKFDIVSNNFTDVFVQGDTSSAVGIALAAFNSKLKIHHVEAGLRTFDKHSPFPEEMNRLLISKLADYHYCPTENAVKNLNNENIVNNVFNVGNTIVDVYKDYSKKMNKNSDYFLVSLHRRENRGDKMISMIEQLNQIQNKIIYITHPSIDKSFYEQHVKSRHIQLIEPVNYFKMIELIQNCKGIISDSGGLQEEAACANKKILVCRDTTEREEIIEYGYGILVNDQIINNISFFYTEINSNIKNPYGENVSEKITKIVKNL